MRGKSAFSMFILYWFFVSCFCWGFFGASRPSDHLVATTFSFTAFIVGEFAQGVSGVAYLMPGSKAEV